jgi:hypothetical protein
VKNVSDEVGRMIWLISQAIKRADSKTAESGGGDSKYSVIVM